MNERTEAIIEAMARANLSWKSCFEAVMTIGERDYELTIMDDEESVFITARLPVRIRNRNRANMSAKISGINNALSCGEFEMDDEGNGITFHLYDLHCGAENSDARMSALLAYCREVLADYGEELCRAQDDSDIGWLQSLLNLFA